LGDAGHGLAFAHGNIAARRSALGLPAEKICIESPGGGGVFGQKTEPAHRTWPIGGYRLLGPCRQWRQQHKTPDQHKALHKNPNIFWVHNASPLLQGKDSRPLSLWELSKVTVVDLWLV